MLSVCRRVSILSSVSLFSYYISSNSNSSSSRSNGSNNGVILPLSTLLPPPFARTFDAVAAKNPINNFIKSNLLSHCVGNDNAIKDSKKIVKTLANIDELPLIIGGTSCKSLAEKVAKNLDIELAKHNVEFFKDGEILVKIEDQPGKKIVFIIQTCAEPVNNSIMELLLTISCAKRAGANKVVAVVPYFGYKHHRRGSVVSTNSNSRHLTSSAMDFAKMMQEMGVDRVISVDLQRPGQGQEACFFDNLIPLESINTTDFMVRYFVDKIYKEEPEKTYSPILIVAPNPESLKKARNFQLSLKKKIQRNANLAIFNNAEVASGPIDVNKLEMVGKEHKISGSDVIIVDDLIDTASTLSYLSNFLHDSGARNIYVFASHGLFTGDAMKNIENSHVKKVVVTNSLPLANHEYVSPKIEELELDNILAHVIKMEYLRTTNLDFDDYKNPEDSTLQDFEDHFSNDK